MIPVNTYKAALELTERYSELSAEKLLEVMIEEVFKGKMCLVSSFGAESAVLVSMVAKIDPNLPIIFIDTQKLFSKTLEYRDKLAEHLSLMDVRTYYPDYSDVSQSDADGTLWQKDTNSCCYIRKVKPLERALNGFDAWITGRKRFHGGKRIEMPMIEAADGRIKINPLANWDRKKIESSFQELGLPPHPLVQDGFLSIGCAPCTVKTDGDDIRSGRWKDQEKSECGIHLDKDGKFVSSNIV